MGHYLRGRAEAERGDPLGDELEQVVLEREVLGADAAQHPARLARAQQARLIADRGLAADVALHRGRVAGCGQAYESRSVQ